MFLFYLIVLILSVIFLVVLWYVINHYYDSGSCFVALCKAFAFVFCVLVPYLFYKTCFSLLLYLGGVL